MTENSKYCFKIGGGKVPTCECLYVHQKLCLFLLVYEDDIKVVGKEKNISPTRKSLQREVVPEDPTSILNQRVNRMHATRR